MNLLREYLQWYQRPVWLVYAARDQQISPDDRIVGSAQCAALDDPALTAESDQVARPVVVHGAGERFPTLSVTPDSSLITHNTINPADESLPHSGQRDGQFNAFWDWIDTNH